MSFFSISSRLFPVGPVLFRKVAVEVEVEVAVEVEVEVAVAVPVFSLFHLPRRCCLDCV